MRHNLFPLACGLIASTQMSTAAIVDKPNIIVLLVDDLGYGDLSCQGVAQDIHTPNIDKLLNQGIRFTNFHANCPVSSPSRASVLTGRYPDMVGVPGVIRTRENDSWGYLSPEAVLLPEMTKRCGYKSAIIGKWHLGLESPNTPNERGFDYFYGFLGDMMDDYYTHLRRGFNYMRENHTVINPQGHATDIFTDATVQYIQSQQTAAAPFMLYLAYNAPHGPIQPPAAWYDKVHKREPQASETRAKLIALIEHLDYNIGKVYDSLESTGQLENTLIIFASDNGGDYYAGANNKPFRGAKQDMYEGGICVPAGVYWKNHITPAVSDNLVMHMDILPTICDLLGLSVEHKVDGMSILPLLEGKAQTTDERMVYFVRREGNNAYGGKAYYAAYYKGHKILQNTPFLPLEYFDLNQDRQEQNDLINQKDPQYQKLFNGMMEHIRISGSIPWTKPQK